MKEMVAFLVQSRRASALLILLACAIIYGNSLGNSFHYDDKHSIVENHHIRSLAAIPAFFWTPEHFSRDADKAMYRPLLLASLALNYAWGEYDTYSYHVVNVVIHSLCSLLVWALLGTVGISPCMALMGGLVFAVHPVCAEPVNYISSRSELLSTLGVLGSCWMYGVAERSCDSRWRMGSVLCFAAGLLSKSVAITTPLLLVALDAAGGRITRRSWRSYLPYLLVAALYLLWDGTA